MEEGQLHADSMEQVLCEKHNQRWSILMSSEPRISLVPEVLLHFFRDTLVSV